MRWTLAKRERERGGGPIYFPWRVFPRGHSARQVLMKIICRDRINVWIRSAYFASVSAQSRYNRPNPTNIGSDHRLRIKYSQRVRDTTRFNFVRIHAQFFCFCSVFSVLFISRVIGYTSHHWQGNKAEQDFHTMDHGAESYFKRWYLFVCRWDYGVYK